MRPINTCPSLVAAPPEIGGREADLDDGRKQEGGRCIETLHLEKKKGTGTRGNLLVNLKERSGLTYSRIAKLDYFADLSINSLGSLYHRFRKK